MSAEVVALANGKEEQETLASGLRDTLTSTTETLNTLQGENDTLKDEFATAKSALESANASAERASAAAEAAKAELAAFVAANEGGASEQEALVTGMWSE